MRYKENELLGLIEIIYGEDRYQFEKSPYVQSFVQTVYDIMKIKKENIKKQIFRMVKIASS